MFACLRSQSSCTVRRNRFLLRTAKMSTSINSQKLLSGIEDVYQGVTVDLGKEISLESSKDVDGFSSVLRQTLEHWKTNRKRGIWLRIPSTHAHLIGCALDLQFKMHHCQEEYVILVKDYFYYLR